MSQLSLFGSSDRPTNARAMAAKLQALAHRGVYFGTSSWKYEGWLGTIYTRDRYLSRGKFSQKKFEAECLAEYAETFPIVGGDFSFYQFPSPAYWKRLFGETPESLLFGLKVPEDITVPKWPSHARYGSRAGTINRSFLDKNLLHELFTWPLEAYRHRIAVLMFEFGTFAKSTFARPAEFLARLDPFLEGLSRHFRYAVEIRNPEYLIPEYFETLRAHNTAHIFNAWTRMPELGEQIAIPGAFTADFTVVRALLRKGQTYEQAVQAYEPYERTVDPNPAARAALKAIAERAWKTGQPAYLFVNNRLEGNAPSTIEAVVSSLELEADETQPAFPPLSRRSP
jgi:uncharacterized protein YecE (DUF72 family)